MTKLKVAEIILDFSLYPRIDVDDQNVRYIVGALEAGKVMPPIIIDRKSKRCVDGFHRTRAYTRLHGGDHEVEVIDNEYASEAEMLLDAIRFNASHGRTLSTADRTHCIIRCEELKLEPAIIASELNLTIERYGELRLTRIGKLTGKRQTLIPLKRTIAHMAGRTLTSQQVETNKRLSGMNTLFYVNQLIMLIESDLIDKSSAEVLDGLKRLASLIRAMKAAA